MSLQFIFTRVLGDPTYDDNIDSYRLIAVSNDSIESISNTISVEKPYALYASLNASFLQMEMALMIISM